MKRILTVLLALMMVLASAPVLADSAGTTATGDIKGSLVIVGGALRADNDAVYNAFIARAGGKEKAKIGIVPAASGNPAKYAKMFQDDMVARGLDASQIVILPLAVKNDSKSKDVDESLWVNNGSNPEVVKMVSDLTGVWFVGGDQLRITQVLLNADGTRKPVLDEIWKVYQNGAVIGGTSAGAAIMSDIMIAGGDSLTALSNGYTADFDATTLDYQNAGGLVVSKGLGFFKEGIVDQHFDRKARLGRLAVVGYDNKATYPVTYGVEENTAMIVDYPTGKISVAGTAGVVVLDSRNAAKEAKTSTYQGFRISYLEGKDQYDLKALKAVMDPAKYTTIGYEYNNTENVVWGGPLSANQRLRDYIGFELIDNEAKSSVTSYLFGEKSQGFAFDFSKLVGADGKSITEGYWGQAGTADLYSFENVGMAIHPVHIAITPTNKTVTPAIVVGTQAPGKATPAAKSSNVPASKIVNNLPKTYVVKSGDMLWKIAKNHGVTLEALIEANLITNPNLLRVGQTLNLPQ